MKFAKYAPLLNENDMNLVIAIDFINQTKAEIADDEMSVPVEITIEEKRSKQIKLALIVGIVSLAIMAIVIIYLIGHDVYNLFF